MGDSSACLMQVQPFCYASGLSNEAKEGNPIHALGQSVSFGRFVSESLAWDKWSSFSHNRYVEEAERFSRPGSVAQKKAFFEAHYKKLAAQKAAALLEQENNAAQTSQEHEAVVDNTHNSKTSSPISKLANEENAKVLKSRPATMLRDHGCNSNFQNQLEDADARKEQGGKISRPPPPPPPIVTAELKQGSNSDQEVLKPEGNNKLPVSSFKLLDVIGTPKFTSTPIKSTAPAISSADNIADSMSNNPALSSADHKKRSTTKSLRVSLNFTPIREINKLTASVMRKFDSTRVGAGSSRASRTPTKASKDELHEHSSLTQLTEKKRNKMTSPIISSPFSLRTEERAVACGKKKLEEMFNDNEAQNMQLHTKLKDKAKKRIRKLRHSFCFRAGPLPESYIQREASKREIEKDRQTQPESPKQGRRPTPSIVKSKPSLNGTSLDNNGIKNFQGKTGSTLTVPITSNSTMITTHENTSPNIQHGNLTEIANEFRQRAECR